MSQSHFFTITQQPTPLSSTQQKLLNFYSSSDRVGPIRFVEISPSIINDRDLLITLIIPGVNNSEPIEFTIVDVLFDDSTKFVILGEGLYGLLDIYVTSDGIGASIDLVNRLFSVIPFENNLGLLVERNLSNTTETLCSSNETSAIAMDYCSGDCGNAIVDVLILRTPEANAFLQANMGGMVEWFLFFNFWNINVSFVRSEIPGKIVRYTWTDFNPDFAWSNNMFVNERIAEDMNAVSTDQEALDMMTLFGADIVVLLTNNNYTGPIFGGGTGTIFGRTNSLDPESSNKFCIVQVPEIDNSRFTGAHEIAHQFGCLHSIPLGEDCPHGTNMQNGRNTIMANNAANFTRISNFSNPNVLFGGIPTGLVGQRDNAQQIRSAFCETANNLPDHFSVIFTPNSPLLCLGGGFQANFTAFVTQGYCAPWSPPGSCDGPPYQFEWSWSRWHDPDFTNSHVLSTAQNLTLTIAPNMCPAFYLRLKVTSANGLMTSFTKFYHTLLCSACSWSQQDITSFSDSFTSDLITYFPNPASDILYISRNSSDSILGIQCYSVAGNEVFIEYMIDDSLIQIDLSKLVPGLYLFRIQATSSSSVLKVIIE